MVVILTELSSFSTIPRVCYLYRDFGYFFRECPSYEVIIPLAQTIPQISEIHSLPRGGI